jgi:NADP-dependent 3-hydroxy acid dehydrogenase YdfG
MEKWEGKIAVVTGASSGIGEAIVRDLAKHGLTVIGLARRSEKVEEISREFAKGKVSAIKCDVSELASIKSAFKEIEQKFSHIHVLINNAGISMYQKVLDDSDETTEKVNKVIDTNLTGLVHCTREGIRLMKKSNDFGIVINVGSILDSVIPFPNMSSIYTATKHAVRAFTETIRQELIVSNIDKIRVANVSPGVVKTNIGHAGGRENADEFYDKLSHLQSEDISQGIIYMLSTPTTVNVTQITIKPVGERF